MGGDAQMSGHLYTLPVLVPDCRFNHAQSGYSVIYASNVYQVCIACNMGRMVLQEIRSDGTATRYKPAACLRRRPRFDVYF